MCVCRLILWGCGGEHICGTSGFQIYFQLFCFLILCFVGVGFQCRISELGVSVVFFELVFQGLLCTTEWWVDLKGYIV
jgi:hypothetical protein